MEKKIIIIPDVHGRDFWKIVKDIKDIPIVFLGDYLDPYTDTENITPEQSIYNFQEILDFADSNKDMVTLLYGNHDSSYAFRNMKLCKCRHDWENGEQIEMMFEDYQSLFKFAHEIEINNKKFLITHAGINPYWIKNHEEIFGSEFDYCADTINNIPKDKLIPALCDISYYRGGYGVAGSLLWSDIEEHVIEVKQLWQNEGFVIPDNLIQVFGHTQLQKPIKVDCGLYDIYCLDAREVFYIDNNGVVRYFNNDKEVEQYLN